MLLKELKKNAKNHTFVNIERKSINDDELYGYILDVSEVYILLEVYTDTGIFNGYTVFGIEQISAVSWGTRFHESITILIDKNIERPIPNLQLTTFEDIINQLNQEYEAIAFLEYEDEDEFEIAKALSLEGDWMKLACLGNQSTLSKYTKMVNVKNCSRVEFARPYIDSIISLHKRKPN